jgi:hypothetical protein
MALHIDTQDAAAAAMAAWLLGERQRAGPFIQLRLREQRMPPLAPDQGQ